MIDAAQLHLADEPDAAAPAPEPYLTVEDAAAIARCSAKTIRRAIYAGQLRAFRPATRVLLREADVRAWVESRSAAADTCQPRPRGQIRRPRPGSVQALRDLERELAR